jgi:hypothetical protein
VQTGRHSGVLAVSVHPDGKGEEILKLFNTNYEVPPHTPVVIEGVRGIRTYLYAHPGKDEIVPGGHLANALTLSGEGDFFVAPPSRTVFERTYWVLPDGPSAILPADYDLKLPPAPIWMCVLSDGKRRK